MDYGKDPLKLFIVYLFQMLLGYVVWMFFLMHLFKVSWGLDGIVCDALFLRDSQRLDVLGLSIGSGQ